MEHLLGLRISNRSRFQGLSIAISITLMLFASVGHAETGPFAGLAGNWSGNGTISLGNGSRESIRCRARYSVSADGNGLQQSLRCASDSYRFEVSSTVESRGGSLSGSWSEATRNVSGQISGRAAGGHIRARVDAGVFAADLTVNTSGNQQSVAIVPQGTDIRIVAVTMSRRAD